MLNCHWPPFRQVAFGAAPVGVGSAAGDFNSSEKQRPMFSFTNKSKELFFTFDIHTLLLQKNVYVCLDRSPNV